MSERSYPADPADASLRLFLTWATWNTAARDAGIVGQAANCDSATSTSAFKCDTNGITFGAQAEAWW